jgi:hypothetical protein
MKMIFRTFFSLMVVSISLTCRPTDCWGESVAGNIHEPTSGEATLKAYLQTMDASADSAYVAAFRDLNGDGVDEAIVYLLGSNWCGSGGCNMLVLRQERGSWKVVSTITIVRPPVRVLESTSNGWRDIGVWVQGGGIRRGYEAELRFNGKTYSRNPSIPPAKYVGQGASGETVIAAPLKSKPLRNG